MELSNLDEFGQVEQSVKVLRSTSANDIAAKKKVSRRKDAKCLHKMSSSLW